MGAIRSPFVVFVGALASTQACGGSSDDSGASGDADADSDGDVDGDADGDSDGDSSEITVNVWTIVDGLEGVYASVMINDSQTARGVSPAAIPCHVGDVLTVDVIDERDGGYVPGVPRPVSYVALPVTVTGPGDLEIIVARNLGPNDGDQEDCLMWQCTYRAHNRDTGARCNSMEIDEERQTIWATCLTSQCSGYLRAYGHQLFQPGFDEPFGTVSRDGETIDFRLGDFEDHCGPYVAP